MIAIFGSNGYMGTAIVRECEARGIPYVRGKRGNVKEVFRQLLEFNVQLAVNAAAFIPQPTVDECKNNIAQTVDGNVEWPFILAQACEEKDIPVMHLSTGCLFNEEKEYTEKDEPTRGWTGYCGFYVGTKLLSEKLVARYWKHYILRLRLPFDEVDHPRNYLSKLASFHTVFEHTNSLTHRGDFAKWTLDLWRKRAVYGTYHCVNAGQITAKALVLNMAQKGLITNMPGFTQTPSTSGARLSIVKLASAGVEVRNVHEAVADAIKNWTKY